MILSNDEMMIWSGKAHMVIGGDISGGDLVITNRRLGFITEDQKRTIFTQRKVTDLWEIDIWKVMDVELIGMKGYEHPLIRFRYKEDETYFTFPDLEPRPALAAIIVFINHARLFSKNMALLRSIDSSLSKGELELGERLPKLVIDQQMKADETCHQCAKEMLVEESDRLSSEISECIYCELDE